MRYGLFDENGVAQAFYWDEINSPESIPTSAVELTDEQWLDLVTNQATARWIDGAVVHVSLPPAPRQIYKADIWRRATNAEADIMDAMLDSQPARLRRMWADAQYLQSDDELYATIEAALIGQFGATRAAELLA